MMAKRTRDNWRHGGNGLWLPERPEMLVPRGMGRLPATVREWGGGCFAGCCEDVQPPACGNCECPNCKEDPPASGKHPAPCCWRVSISGMADGTCSTCEKFNGSWYLSQDAENGCTWSVRIPKGCTGCDAIDLVLTVYEDAGDYKIKVEMIDDADAVLHKWEKNYGGTKPDCCGLEDTLSLVTNDGDCDSDSAVCSIASTDTDPDECYAECEDCTDACIDGRTPVLVQATISGLVNARDCDHCELVDGTYTLEYVGNCRWQYVDNAIGYCNRFGIMIAINLQTSFLTPPFGFALFYLRGVAPPEIATAHIYRGVIPFIVIQLLLLVVLSVWPEIISWLPAQFADH